MIINKIPVEEWPIYQNWLKTSLTSGTVNVTFLKKDGTERKMDCTLSPKLVPPPEITDVDKPKKERKISDSSIAVYDLGTKSWKSFRWDSLISVTVSTNLQ